MACHRKPSGSSQLGHRSYISYYFFVCLLCTMILVYVLSDASHMSFGVIIDTWGTTLIPSPSARKPGENCADEAVVGCNRLCLCFKALPQSQARKVDLLLPSWCSSCAGQRLINVQINNLKNINGCVLANQNEARRLLSLTGKVCRKNLDCHIRGCSDG
jgi:hypothetical protein